MPPRLLRPTGHDAPSAAVRHRPAGAPARSHQTSRGIGAHTDYGLLVIAAQDDVGGLYVRPPVAGEWRPRNWLEAESAAGLYQDQEPWTYVRPVPDVLTVFPGDILQFLTGGALLSTPHKVSLNVRERFALAYFHEPSFEAVVHPLAESAEDEYIHYGTHFTNMFMRCYPDRVTSRRISAEDRLAVLAGLRDAALDRGRSRPRANGDRQVAALHGAGSSPGQPVAAARTASVTARRSAGSSTGPPSPPTT